MTHRIDVARGRDILARWCALAEQRLEYLTELFESGRWRRFHTEITFLENIREAKSAVETWRNLSMRESSRDNSAVDIACNGRSRTSQPPRQALPDPFHRLRPQPVVTASPLNVSIAAQTGHIGSNGVSPAPASSAATMDLALEAAVDSSSKQTLDIDAIARRYPLLRNAL
jgi:uncharacterized repeat protein (TIGR03809 family)